MQLPENKEAVPDVKVWNLSLPAYTLVAVLIYKQWSIFIGKFVGL